MTAVESYEEFLDRQEIDGIELVPADEENPERYRLTSLDAADWAFRKLAREKARHAELLEQARRERDRIDAWLEEACAPIESSIEYFGGLLREWAAGEVLTEFAEVQDWSKVRRKTLSTPNGKVRARRSTDGTFTVNSELLPAALAALSEAGRDELVVLTPKLGASLLDAAREQGTVRVDALGEYEVADVVTGEWRKLPGVRRNGRGQITFTVEVAT